VPLQHLLYLIILFEAVDTKSFRNVILLSVLAFIVFTLVTALLYTKTGYFNVLAYCAGCILIILGILMKFYEMLQNPSDFNFLKIPFFYLLFAYLLFIVGTLPYFTMGNWLHYVKHGDTVQLVMENTMSVLNYILYITYSFVFLWILRKKECF
jgi:hypothetical protein